jgi:hypothetical protein
MVEILGSIKDFPTIEPNDTDNIGVILETVVGSQQARLLSQRVILLISNLLLDFYSYFFINKG